MIFNFNTNKNSILVQNQEEEFLLNVITFNIGAFTLEKGLFENRIDPIAHYLGKGKYDIIALQEAGYGRKEGEQIVQRLEDLGYGKYYFVLGEQKEVKNPEIEHGLGVYVLSKYPVFRLATRYSRQRAILTKIEHPLIGDIYVVSAHPSSDSRCEGPTELVKKINSEPQEVKQNLILMADMNALIYDLDKDIKLKAMTGKLCDEKVLMSKYNFFCEDKLNCFSPKDGIDWIIPLKDSSFYIQSRFLLSDMYSQINIPGSGWQNDYHMPVSAKIGTKKPILIPTPSSSPTPVPTVEATPEDKPLSDLNEDSQVDITDFALFVEYYKQGNVKIDYDKDGQTVRDIDDLRYFFNNYKLQNLE
ncbi:hypothetical protein KBD45_00475 [Candidatus Dojkabacteria bacterium]|nr:hypothetical protein [Candidatus Dojkabacteria bacterium]